MLLTLLITTHNRSEYLKRCLDSVANADLSVVQQVVIVDDSSGNRDTKELIKTFDCGKPVLRWRTYRAAGIKDTLRISMEEVFKFSDIICTLDGDAIVTQDCFVRMADLKRRYPDRIISGFNCADNPLVATHEDYYLRKHCNGINMVISRAQYDEIIRPSLLRYGNWDYNISSAAPFVMTKPSVVQHIGMVSSMGHNQKTPDTATDFGRLLPDITLLGIDAHDPEGIRRAAAISQLELQFGHVEVITDRVFYGREAYSQYFIEMLPRHIKTSHVLIIHPDGYVLNPGAWDDNWLQYDYIGAKWAWYDDGYRNGNGGFCLRSKRLHEVVAQLARDGRIKETHPEDHVIGRVLRPLLEAEYGLRFAPDDVCDKFSIEAWGRSDRTYKGEFGFHGYNIEGMPYGLEPPKRKTDEA